MLDRNKKSIFVPACVMFLLFNSFIVNIDYNQVHSLDPFFTLVAKTNDNGIRPNFLYVLKDQLVDIGINLDVIIQDWPVFVGELISFRDFDICYVGLSVGGGYVGLTGCGADPDFTGVYNENGSLNLFGYHTSMDWDDDLDNGINEWYMKQGKLIMPPNSEERVEHYWAWEQYLMDKILPCQPTIDTKQYSAHWANLKGYDFDKDLLQSWGKMFWDGTHLGQLDNTEVVISDSAWSDLNPLFQDDNSSLRISNAVLDSLIWYDADLSVWPHLAESYTYIDDTTIEIVVRQGIKWQDDPSALFTNEYLDVEDVYFTLYCWKYVSYDVHLWDWISDMEIVDDYTMKIYVDADDTIPGAQSYAPSLPALATRILPEHYLNQTQLTDGITPNKFHPSWNTFATNAFGTGLFEITDYTEDVETTLTTNPDCWWLDNSITSDPNLDWVNRFGDFSGGLDQLRIKIIPDLENAMNEFESGTIDLLPVTGLVDIIDPYTTDPDFIVQSKPLGVLNFFGYNMRETRLNIGDRTPCEDYPSISKGLAIRKAISYAMDRNVMNALIYNSTSSIIDCPIFSNLGIWCNPYIIRYEHNLTLALGFMTLAGFDTGYPFILPPPPTTPPPEPTPTPTTPTPGITKIFGVATITSVIIFGSSIVLILSLKRRKKI